MSKKKTLVKLNRSDFLLFVMNDILASMSQVITMHFRNPVGVEEIREVSRYLLTMFPKLRSIIVPTLFGYKFQILDDDDERVNVLFNDAFQVKHHIKFDTDEYYRYRRDMMNEPFPLEQGLPIKFRFMPDDPNPVLFMSVDHMVADGMAYVQMMSAVLEYLNGKKPQIFPLDNPSMKPALLERNFLKIPFQILRSYVLYKRERWKHRKDKIVSATSRPVGYFSPADSYNEFCDYKPEELKAKAKELGAGLSAFFLTALSRAFFRRTANDKDSGNTTGILITFDLRAYFPKYRPVFGNYIRTVLIRAYREQMDNPMEMMMSIQGQLKKFREDIEKKKIIFPWIIEELSKLLGRKNFARFLRYAKRKRLYPLTCHFSTIGDAGFLNLHGTKAQVGNIMVSTPHQVFLIGTGAFEGKMVISTNYPEAEYTREDVIDIINSFKDEIGKLLKL